MCEWDALWIYSSSTSYFYGIDTQSRQVNKQAGDEADWHGQFSRFSQRLATKVLRTVPQHNGHSHDHDHDDDKK